MPSGRLEKETNMFNKIDKQLNNLPKIFTDYYYALRAEKKSYRTIQEYLKSIRSFMKHITNGKNDDKFYANIKPIDVNKYLISLETKTINGEVKPTSSSFRATNWYALNSFFEFLVDNKYVDENPISKKSRPKVTDNPSVTYLTEEEISRIMDNIKHTAKPNMVNRDLCIFAIGVTTGLRVAAITQINTEDIDLQNNVIRVIEKRNKTFDVMFGDSVKEILISWLRDRRKYFPETDTNALFISQYNERISYDAVRKLLIKYAKDATDKNVTPHVMRHSCATNLYEKTNDIYLCATQLHHTNVTTTQRYAEVSNASKKKATTLLDKMIK